MSNTKQPTFSEWYDSLTPDKRAEIERRTVTDQNITGVYAEAYHNDMMKWWAVRDFPTDTSIMRQATQQGFFERSFLQGAKLLSPIIAGLRKEVSALERFRAEDAMSAINEANQLRKELAEAKEHIKTLIEHKQAVEKNAAYEIGKIEDVVEKLRQQLADLQAKQPDGWPGEEERNKSFHRLCLNEPTFGVKFSYDAGYADALSRVRPLFDSMFTRDQAIEFCRKQREICSRKFTSWQSHVTIESQIEEDIANAELPEGLREKEGGKQ